MRGMCVRCGVVWCVCGMGMRCVCGMCGM